MNATEIGDVLALAAARDRRTIGEADVLAWLEDLDDITFDEAREAIRRHYRSTTDWLTAAHIRHIVRTMRAAQRPKSAPLALQTYGWGNPRPGQAARNERGRALCAAEIGRTA